jgi:hypothetical protein
MAADKTRFHDTVHGGAAGNGVFYRELAEAIQREPSGSKLRM